MLWYLRIGYGCTLSAEKIFCGENAGFLFVSCGLFVVLYGVSGAVFAVLA